MRGIPDKWPDDLLPTVAAIKDGETWADHLRVVSDKFREIGLERVAEPLQWLADFTGVGYKVETNPHVFRRRSKRFGRTGETWFVGLAQKGIMHTYVSHDVLWKSLLLWCRLYWKKRLHRAKRFTSTRQDREFVQ